jgi:prolyl-tRNA synthetase
LIWPITVAPYQVHLVNLIQPPDITERLYQDLVANGIEILVDDRDESPGVKFNDADLIGLPLRITVGDRGLKQGGVELKRRTSKDKTIVPLDKIVATVQSEIAALEQEIAEMVVEVPFRE